MRCNEQPIDLLVGRVGEREYGPIRCARRVLRAYLDAADDPVGGRRRRNLDPVALIGMAFHDLGQIDRRCVKRHGNGFKRRRTSDAGAHEQQENQELAEMACAQGWSRKIV